jgi:hypothetical protein
MSLGIEEVLRPALGDRSVRFVFPSEICAESWLARCLRLRWGPAALETDRFLGWDRFKEKAAERDGRKPASDPIRRIFAARALEENARRPFLAALIPPEYAGEWQPFAGYLASKLSSLGRLPQALRAAGAEGESLAADWLALRERYLAFLAEIGRFEPSFEPRTLASLPGATVIFFPELIGDYEEYAAALASCPSIRAVALPSGSPRVRLRRPETALGELRDMLSEIGGLLDRGVEAADIAVTIADLERYLPYLEREAELLSVPIAPRAGASLAATTGGRLFAALREAQASDFSYDALRDLLLSPAWPWKERKLARALVSEGRRLHVVAPWTDEGKKIDAWMSSLSGELKSWYRGFRGCVSDLVGAESFEALRVAYNVFKSKYLEADRGKWDEGTDLSLARCVEELGDLVDAEREIKANAKREIKANAERETKTSASAASFGIFMRVLQDKVYVRAGRESGVSVSDWRVSAAIFPDHHFVLGAAQDALSVPAHSLDFLGESLRKRVGAALYAPQSAAQSGGPSDVDRDAGPDFIRAYALSGADVVFSCPEVGWEGEKAAHGYLLSLAAASGQASGAVDDAAAVARDGSYREEAAWLSGRGEAPSRLHRAQAEGIEAAAQAGEVASAAELLLDSGTARLAADSLRRRRRDGAVEELRSVDATAIDNYLACPFRYLYLRLLGARSESSGIDFVDALFLGDVYHEALAQLFARVREEDGRFKPERRDAYRGYVDDCLRLAFEALGRKRGKFVEVVLEAYRSKLALYLELVVDAEAESFPGLEVGPLEEELELPRPELAGGFVLRGRIDRISRSERGAVIVDYKKGKVPEKARVAPDSAGTISEAQIPCYLRLVAAADEKIDSAWYYSIEGGDRTPPAHPVCAFGDTDDKGRGAYVPRDALGGFMKAFDAALRLTAEGVARGAYPLAPKETQKEVCKGCDARGICRERYALRFGSPGGAEASRGGRDQGGRP